jgi:hypothetical protein
MLVYTKPLNSLIRKVLYSYIKDGQWLIIELMYGNTQEIWTLYESMWNLVKAP